MKNYLIILFVLSTRFEPLCSSCSRETGLLTEGDMLFAQHKGASMPVLVRGNFDSDVILLMVHGHRMYRRLSGYAIWWHTGISV